MPLSDVPDIDPNDLTTRILDLVADARAAQVYNWGPQAHALPGWGLLLGAAYGAACQAIHEALDPANRESARSLDRDSQELAAVFAALVEVAAVAVAALEDLLRHAERPAAAWGDGRHERGV